MTDLTINATGVRLTASVFGSFGLPPVLFLHGISNSRDTWEEMVATLSATHQIWTLDFRGHGHSDRATVYNLAGYIADADAALDVIGRRTAVVGHSLGACVAGMLAQQPHPLVAGVFLEDPPWFLGEPGQWERSAFFKLFPMISTTQSALQATNAPLSAYLEFLSNAPSPLGGIAKDHFSPRHLLSHASAVQRQDNKCWGDKPGEVAGAKTLSAIDTSKSFQCPATVVRGDPHLGGALLEGHDARLASTNPQTRILHYEGCGHHPHRMTTFVTRFADDIKAFLARLMY
jgi:pimeloyl-ACP methyl ester carboxylesterase